MRTRLRQARKAKHLTQFALAQTIGVERSLITRYELGINDIPGKVLAHLSAVLEVSMDDLYRNDQDPPRKRKATAHA